MKYKIAFFLLFCSQIITAQTGPYVKLRFSLSNSEMKQLLRSGFDPEGMYKVPTAVNLFEAELSQEELRLVKSISKQTEVLISDLGRYYENRALNDVARNNNSIVPPPGFQLGTMGGFLNYTQIVNMLDSMRRRYPNLISAKKSIGNTLEGNAVYVVKISDHPDKDEPSEKQVLYDAMHHAREPQAMMQLMYFMWYIMDRYEKKDPIAQYIINNRELYFIPIVNPDGYLYNASIAPNGGGMWRKNRSTNIDATRGVDLNRNYSYDWGYDDVGSSPLGNSNTFRGPSAFSEPETQNMRNFVNTKKFKSNLSYHTFGGYLIYPFGARENYYTPDSNMFRLYADSLTKDNGYSAGTVFETLNYFANGGSCDWMYGDTSHSKIFSFTPEVGFANDGFWPAPSRIIPLCEENIAPNLFMAKYTVNGLDVITSDTTFSTENSLSINLTYFSAGLENNKKIKSYVDFYNHAALVSNLDTFNSNGLATFSKLPFSFAVNFNAPLLNKTEIPYRIVSIIDGEIQYDSSILIIDKTVGIKQENRKKEISIYPNPSSSIINIEYTLQKNTSIKLYSIEGKLISEHRSNSIDISALVPGIYFVSVVENNKIIALESFQKQ
jgi:carboxypeptidase T